MSEARRLLKHEDHDRKELRCRRCGYYFCERCSHDCPHCYLAAREGELVAALERERDHWRAALTAFKGNDTVDIDYASALRAESELTRTLTGR